MRQIMIPDAEPVLALIIQDCAKIDKIIIAARRAGGQGARGWPGSQGDGSPGFKSQENRPPGSLVATPGYLWLLLAAYCRVSY